MRSERHVDVLVVGAGPAGLAAAARLAVLGAGAVEVLEREREAGGVPRHCHRTGFGWRELRRPVTGPAYARHMAEEAVRAGATVRTGVTATGWAGPLAVETTSPDGLERIRARAVVLATGARERPRSARLVPGSRPDGVLTTGELQQSVYLYGRRIGTRALVVGAEPVAHHAVRALRHAGVEVAALVTEEPWSRPGALSRVPVLGSTTVDELVGRGRLSGVRLTHRDGRTTTVACDTVVFTGDWIPERELARYGGVVLDPGTRGPAVDGAFRTSEPGVFAVGNVLHGVETAGRAAAEGRDAAESVLAFLTGSGTGGTPGAHWPGRHVPVVVEAPLRWVTPNRVVPPGARRFLLRPDTLLVRPLLTVHQDGRLLYRRRVWGTAAPSRSVTLAGDWTRRVAADGGPVRITAHP
ncbi:NAD(P)/FAD-dependent oxidoreductase [Streptomyces sp. SP18CS02]|uniref:NAD(P)/FAD-dependent oxidoreductase n=1 Tax=Streptomyces sp. SP18CS02 TaxID=3002531 RepID=UPI002E770A87|nr:FAD-dependent oxidoreductase [Streptomyces sp. SP18CS02]MEE1754742.1 FAD-dependent oxidoreductase [Streptomyces sp. SP18CS02]